MLTQYVWFIRQLESSYRLSVIQFYSHSVYVLPLHYYVFSTVINRDLPNKKKCLIKDCFYVCIDVFYIDLHYLENRLKPTVFQQGCNMF